MAQLIKLHDYVSRYEQNILLYPSRFVRLKKKQWESIKDSNMLKQSQEQSTVSSFFDEEPEEKTSFMRKIKDIFIRDNQQETVIESDRIDKTDNNEQEEHDFAFQYQESIHQEIKSEEELKKHFLNQLFRFQMKWASSTLTERSVFSKFLYYDENLKYFLQRFPDVYLIMYKPVFLIKNAPIELETIIITPTDIWCITLLESEDSAVFVGANERFWVKKAKNKEKKILSPILTVNRMEKIIRNVLQRHDVILPIHKVILSRNGYIDFPTVPYDIKLIEKRNYEEWFQRMRSHRSPLKAIQLKSAEILLQYCQTTSIRRYDWDTVEE